MKGVEAYIAAGYQIAHYGCLMILFIKDEDLMLLS